MKKILLVIVSLFMFSSSVFAMDNIGVKLNGELLEFDQKPVIENERTLVPLRAIFEKLGAEVGWIDETQTVTANDGTTNINLRIGDKIAYVNGKAYELDVPAKIIGERTMVPVRFVSEALGAIVDWDPVTWTVLIDREKKTEDTGMKVEIKAQDVDYNISPISVLTKIQFEQLGLNIDKNLSHKEIADEILKWQNNNMYYVIDAHNYNDISDPMRWNYMLPGIYKSADLLKRKTADGKIYGICYDFATIFTTIANYYDLDVRVASMKEKPSELPEIANALNTATAKGMASDEYFRYKTYSEEKGLTVYPYEAIKLVAKETSTHYRAEVKMNGNWVPYDGSTTSSDQLVSKYTFYETNWAEGQGHTDLAVYLEKLANGESLKGVGYNSTYEQFAEGRLIALADGTAEKYVGTKDDRGDMRASSFDDFMTGVALVPYYDSPDKVRTFMNLNKGLEEDLTEAFEIKSKYEEASGDKFYAIIFIIIMSDLKDDEDPDSELFLEQYKEFTGDIVEIDLFTKLYKMIL